MFSRLARGSMFVYFLEHCRRIEMFKPWFKHVKNGV